MVPVALLVVAAASLAAPCAWAHGGEGDAVATLGWNFEPWLVFLLLLALLLYATGIRRLWRHAGASRGISRTQAASFAAGWLALVAALVSPLDSAGALLFSAHMVQHELLMIVAAPLLVLGRPLAAWTWALSPRYRNRIAFVTHWRWLAWAWHGVTQPFAAWGLHAIALWLWHVPQLFEAALASEAVHIAQHVSFLVTALVFWWAVLGADPRSRSQGFALAYLFTTMMHTSALGALLTLAPTVWYPHYAAIGGAFGLDPLEDQQLGGLVMWMPGAFAYVAAALALVARLLSAHALSPAIATRPAPPR